MRSFVPSSLAALFTSREEARDSDDGSALLHAAESSPTHDDRAEDSDVVVSISQGAGEGGQDAPGLVGSSSPTHGDAPTKPSSPSGGSPSDEEDAQQGISARTDSSINCLICLDPIDPLDSRNVVTLGCSCKGPSALRHKSCLDQWLTVKGDTRCDVCGAEMHVPLPPPPPIPGFVVFPELEHTFEVQWGTFSRYLWHNAIAVIVYCFVLALIMDIPLHIALLIALIVLVMIVLRYAVSVGINSIARRTILSFQVPDTA